jgi:putative membrane protein
MKKEHTVLLLINLALIIGFGAVFLARLNYEFLIYVGVIIFFLCLIGISLKKVDYTLGSLVGLTVWSSLHLAGGGITIGEGRLYDLMLIRLSETYPVFRYDQLVHIWGFGTSTLVVFSLLAGKLKKPAENPIALGIVLVMAGLGMGALNEILEFAVTIWVPQSGVGGYLNTSLDLCANLIGAILALVYIRLRYLKA